MNINQIDEFNAILSRLFGAMGLRDPSEATRTAYWDALEDLELPVIEQAARDWERNRTDFPKTSAFRQLALTHRPLPAPDAPRSSSTARQSAREWLDTLNHLFAKARDSGPMSYREAQHHRQVLGMPPPKPCAQPGCPNVATRRDEQDRFFCKVHQ